MSQFTIHNIKRKKFKRRRGICYIVLISLVAGSFLMNRHYEQQRMRAATLQNTYWVTAKFDVRPITKSGIDITEYVIYLEKDQEHRWLLLPRDVWQDIDVDTKIDIRNFEK